MNTDKLIAKLEAYLDLSETKRRKKHAKLLKIIKKLEQKRSGIEADLVEQSKMDETSARYHDLRQELKILTRLIQKAKKQETAD